jgi:hypothetical protein
MVSNIDPLNINVRLYQQISELLSQLETGDADIKTRYMALMAIARMQAVFVALRKEKADGPNRGSSVRKYQAEFQTHAARGRKALARASARPEPGPDSDSELDSIIDGDEDTA